MNGADAIVEILRREGVDTAFCFPISNLQEAMARAGLRVVMARQERVAGNMADGMSRATWGRKIGVFSVQQSAGSENAFSPIAHARTDNSAMLFLPGHYGIDAIGKTPTFDSLDNYAGTLKFGTRLYLERQIQEKLRRAFVALRSGRPGPVMVEILSEAVRAEFSGELDYRPVEPIRMAPDQGAVEAAADLIEQARCPLIWSGSGVKWARASAGLVELAETSGTPVMTTLMGKGGFPEDHPLAAGVGALTATAMADHFLESCDVLLTIGSSLSQSSFTPTVPAGKKMIQCNVSAGELHKNYPAEVAVQADAGLFIAALNQELESRGREQFAARGRAARENLAALRKRQLAEYEAEFNDSGTPINGYRLFAELWRQLQSRPSTLLHESGTSRDIQAPFYVTREPEDYLGWGQSTQLGFSLGAAMGAKLATPDRWVVNAMGDAAVGMTAMDWETAAREQIPITTVVKHDSKFSGYADNHIPESAARFGSDTADGDYAAVARALGCVGIRVTDPGDIGPALEHAARANSEGQPAVLDVITKPTTRLPRRRVG